MKAVVRPATRDDAPALTEVYRDVLRAGHGTVVAPEDAPDVDAMAARIAREATLLVLEVDGIVCGEGSLTPFQPRWVRHVGVIAMHVHPSAQGRGHGRRLLRALLDRGREMGLLRVELYVRADNARAIALYRSEGFVREGLRRAFVRVGRGPAIDDLLMARFFHPPRQEKVLALVVRRDRGTPELLVFTHPSGTVQVPRGTLEPGEGPADGVVRELAEESGLGAVRVVRALTPWDQPQDEREDSGLPVLHRTYAFVLEPEGTLPEAWTWRVGGDGEDRGMRFCYGWQPVGDACLHPVFAEALERLRSSLVIAGP